MFYDKIGYIYIYIYTKNSFLHKKKTSRSGKKCVQAAHPQGCFHLFRLFSLRLLMYATWENPEGLHLFASWLVSPPPAPACHSRLSSCGMLCICVCARASFGCGGRIAAGLGKVWQRPRCKHAHTHTFLHHTFTQTDFSVEVFQSCIHSSGSLNTPIGEIGVSCATFKFSAMNGKKVYI